jgi:hypothetical protein
MVIQIVLAVLVGVAVMACGGTRQFALEGSNQAPGADGAVRIERQDGGNFMVSMSATNLLPPARLSNALTTYVVWFQNPDQTPRRVGTLSYDEGSRGGEMTATTADTSFQVVISGETSNEVATPSEYVVFRAAVEAP